MSDTITYKVEDIFEDIDGDDENVLMNIPPEVSERMGWKPGDTLRITVEDGNLVIVKVEESNGEEQ
jgi:AbrB family looped-hinge helix DNA binding protein